MTMKNIGKFIILFSFIAFSYTAIAQDQRTTETKVADLLARFPAGNEESFNKLMINMLSLEENGLELICSQIIAPGTGDDTKARYAVSGLSQYLSKTVTDKQPLWEKICIKYATTPVNADVKRYFMSQLALIGGDATIEALSAVIADSTMCPSVINVLEAIGSEKAADIIAGSLKSDTFFCAAQAINALARMGYNGDVNDLIKWYNIGNTSQKTAALFALAMSGSTEAFEVLDVAASKASYKWEPTGAVSSLLLYASNIGKKGNIKKMESITKTISANCNTPEANNYRLAAMSILVEIKKDAALPMLLKAVDDPDIAVRGGAIRLAQTVTGTEATKKWIAKYKKVSQEIKPEIISMLGERGDTLALPLIRKAMDNENPSISNEAITALAKLQGSKAVDPILSWILRSNSEAGHITASNVLVTILNSGNINKVAVQLKQSKGLATITLINLLAWSRNQQYFKAVLPYVSSDDIGIRATAMKSLKSLASIEDQDILIKMIASAVEPPEIAELQAALAVAANNCPDEENRSDKILESVKKGIAKEKLIPVLAFTGGQKALGCVLNEFENGSPEIREICFDALTGWKDYSASSALYQICISGNKTYGKAALDGYIRQVSTAPVTDDNKLLLFKKIAPYAVYPDSRAEMIVKAGAIHSYPAFFFVSHYLEDNDHDVAIWAARALQNIALPTSDGGSGLYGDLIRNGLEKSIPLISGPESDYDKEKIRKYLETMTPGEGFKPIFNGIDLSGWHGLVGNPLTRAEMSVKELAAQQKTADIEMSANWSVKDGVIVFNGSGANLCSIKEYGDFEMFVDWKISKEGDSGIYLRGTPQVQIWDTSRTDVGAQVGSGGLYNNKINRSVPLKVADNQVGEWNTFRILCIGDKVSVWLNGELVTDNTTFENYWDPAKPIFEKGPIELQAHGTDLQFRDIYVREISTSEYNLTDDREE